MTFSQTVPTIPLGSSNSLTDWTGLEGLCQDNGWGVAKVKVHVERGRASRGASAHMHCIRTTVKLGLIGFLKSHWLLIFCFDVGSSVANFTHPPDHILAAKSYMYGFLEPRPFHLITSIAVLARHPSLLVQHLKKLALLHNTLRNGSIYSGLALRFLQYCHISCVGQPLFSHKPRPSFAV